MNKKKILILGGFGFIGTNLIKYIDIHYIDEYSVIVFDKLLTHPYGITFDSVEKVYAGDFLDTTNIEYIFKNHKIDLVIHSLSTTVPVTSKNSRFDIESNLIPTIEVLDLMLLYGVKDIIYISSGGAIYGNGNKHHKETNVNFPLSSYGIVKLAIEKYLHQYSELYGLRALILRLSNPYGKYHYFRKTRCL